MERKKFPDSFKAVTQYTDSGYGYYDQLDGKNLEKGERVDVWFPDGAMIVGATVETHESIKTSIDHGSHIDIPTVQTFIRTMCNGAHIELPLRNPGINVRRST